MNKCSETLAGWGGAESNVRIGLDVGDKSSRWAGIDVTTGELREGVVATTPEAVRESFGAAAGKCVVVLEAGSHTPWLARTLKGLGHRAVVVDPAILVQGGRRRRKNDRRDALGLMEVARDVGRPKVKELWQRPEQQQAELSLMRMRDSVVRARALVANAIRGAVKPYGERIAKHSVESLPKFAREELSERTQAIVAPALALLEETTKAVDAYDAQVEEYLERRPESKRLLQVHGVGPVTTGVFLAVIGDPGRFKRSRDVAAYLGLVPGQDQSGDDDPQKGISKSGDALCRRMLVQCAQFTLSAKGQDSALRRWGLELAGDGKNKARKKRAVVAVARKLATLLHRLWASGERYEPLRGIAMDEEEASRGSGGAQPGEAPAPGQAERRDGGIAQGLPAEEGEGVAA